MFDEQRPARIGLEARRADGLAGLLVHAQDDDGVLVGIEQVGLHQRRLQLRNMVPVGHRPDAAGGLQVGPRARDADAERE